MDDKKKQMLFRQLENTLIRCRVAKAISKEGYEPQLIEPYR